MLLMAISIFALAGLIIPSAVQTSYEAGPRCERGELTYLEDHPVDRNNDNYICVFKIIEIPSGKINKVIYVGIDNLICPPDCGGAGL